MNMVSVVTGDLVEHGSTAEYEHLRVLLATLVMPFFVIPGNNDSREGMREAFGSEGYLPRAGFLHYAIEQYPLRIVALDTHIPGEHGGLPCAERLAWFDSALAAAPARPTRPDAPLALRHRHRAYGPLRAAGHRRLWRDRVPQSADRAHLARLFCIARSTAALPARSPGPRRARPIRSCSISSRRHRCNSLRAARLPAPALARGRGARQPHRGVRRSAWLLSVSRRRLSYRGAIVPSEFMIATCQAGDA
jgi:hypothetical protein